MTALLLAAAMILTACGTQTGKPARTDEISRPSAQAPDAEASTAAAQSKQTTQPSSLANTGTGVSLEKAKEIALAHAGLVSRRVAFTKAKRETNDGGVAVYAVEFADDGFEYEYEIHAGTGVILDSDRRNAPAAARPTAAQPSQSDDPGEISLEKAKEIALAHAGFIAVQAKFERARKEKKHGIAVYEIKFKKDGGEYEYEIHAGTGVILKSKGKHETTQSSKANDEGRIGLEWAKAIALADAGFSAEQVRFKKAKRDGGKYEIEFVKDKII